MACDAPPDILAFTEPLVTELANHDLGIFIFTWQKFFEPVVAQVPDRLSRPELATLNTTVVDTDAAVPSALDTNATTVMTGLSP